MLLSNYEGRSLLFNQNFQENLAAAGVDAYRGELVIREGDVGDAQGRRKPPKSVLKQAVMLSAERIKMLSGFLDELAELPALLECTAPILRMALP